MEGIKYHDDLKRVIAFHGHMCPGLAYGYRVARTAIDRFGRRAEDEDLVAIVENKSCAVDAIQVLTGCTLGKGNLMHYDYGKQVYTFYDRSTESGLRFSIDFLYPETPEAQSIWNRFLDGEKTPEILATIADLKNRKIHAILQATPEELMKIKEVRISAPPAAKIFKNVQCGICGEKVMEPRARIKNGAIVCIPCLGPQAD